MMDAARGDRRRALRWLACLGALAAVVAALAANGALTGTASADCTQGGSGCLPQGGGYTYDSGSWNCGPINTQDGTNCWANGTTVADNGVRHTYGWASAAYNGSGTTTVCAGFQNGAAFGCGTNLARICYQANCNDQDSTSVRVSVQNWSPGGIFHTVWGHAEA
jgi:hypothetical protein